MNDCLPASEYPQLRIEPLATGWWNDMGSVSGKEEISILHLVDHKTSHWGNRLFKYFTRIQYKTIAVQSTAELFPNPFIAPIVEDFVLPNL